MKQPIKHFHYIIIQYSRPWICCHIQHLEIGLSKAFNDSSSPLFCYFSLSTLIHTYTLRYIHIYCRHHLIEDILQQTPTVTSDYMQYNFLLSSNSYCVLKQPQPWHGSGSKHELQAEFVALCVSTADSLKVTLLMLSVVISSILK